jgi:hypothetical protein
MLATQAKFFRSGNFTEVIGLFVVLAVVIFFALLWYAREGRNSVLENLVVQREFEPPEGFRGTLTVQEHKPGRYLRLSKNTSASRRLQFWYRWVIGTGRQAIFDEVTIDGSRGSVELKRKNRDMTALFSGFSALRMREVAGGRDLSAFWHIELIPREGKPLPFVTSERGDRRTMFEQTASVAKAVSTIMAIPVLVFVAGNIWTPGWPPKNPAASS